MHTFHFSHFRSQWVYCDDQVCSLQSCPFWRVSFYLSPAGLVKASCIRMGRNTWIVLCRGRDSLLSSWSIWCLPMHQESQTYSVTVFRVRNIFHTENHLSGGSIYGHVLLSANSRVSFTMIQTWTETTQMVIPSCHLFFFSGEHQNKFLHLHRRRKRWRYWKSGGGEQEEELKNPELFIAETFEKC